MQINELAMQAKNGDVSAFEQLYTHFTQRLFYHIRKKIQNRQDAEDVLQDVFIKSYKGLASLRPGKIYFSSWLFTIANNSINDYFRKKYRRPEIISIDENFEVADTHSLDKEIMAKSDLETTQKNFSRLPVLHRYVLELKLFQDMSVNEMAKTLNKSDLAVRLLQYQARKKLKSLVAQSTGLAAVK